MSNTSVYLTNEGFLEIEEELNELKNVKRPEVIKALKDARALGDLSENADYDAARAEQAQIEGRIVELEKIMENAIIIESRELIRWLLVLLLKLNMLQMMISKNIKLLVVKKLIHPMIKLVTKVLSLRQ